MTQVKVKAKVKKEMPAKRCCIKILNLNLNLSLA